MDYAIHLSCFDGPLDLLLHLILKSKLDIRDVSLRIVTGQYLEYMSQTGELEPDSASEFLNVAATLLFIKSRSLLPKPEPEPEASEDEPDPETALLQRLREYREFKAAAAKLDETLREAEKFYCRLPDEYPLPPPVVTLREISAERLFQAFKRALERAADRRELPARFSMLNRDKYTAAACASFLRSALRGSKKRTFRSLFSDADRYRLVSMFIALLELIAVGEVRAFQTGGGELYLQGAA